MKDGGTKAPVHERRGYCVLLGELQGLIGRADRFGWTPGGGWGWMDAMDGERSAFVETAALLGRQVREAAVDHGAFARRMRVCDLAKCRATCCHDGVVLGEEEVRVIGEVVEAFGEELRELGWAGGDWLEEEGGGRKTATRRAEEAELAEEFPAHFPKTRCVFLDGEHRCVLQRLAVKEGRHPWFWKPMSCWMQPLRLEGRERPLLTLARAGGDPMAREGYPGFSSCTPCGKEEAGGCPAGEVLRAELEMLGAFGGRDLVREIE